MVVGTNKSLTAPCRGYTCQELYFSSERLMDMIAEKLGMDPAEIRFLNFVQPEEFPYTTATGGIYESGSYQKAFQLALDMVDYRKWRDEQKKARKEGRYIGIGIATIVDPSVTNISYVTTALTPEMRARSHPKSGSGEAVTIKMDPLGKVHVITSTNPQGQGHETVISQIVADQLEIHPEDVTVSTDVDTHKGIYTITTGSYSSRFSSVGTTAIVDAAHKLKEKILRIGAHLLVADAVDVELAGGKVRIKSAPERAISVKQIAGTSHWNQAALPEGMDAGLFATSLYTMPTSQPADEKDLINSSNTYGFCCEVIVLEIDPATGVVKFHKWASVHDAGTILNPMLVEGQVMGSIAQALGGSMYEEFAYDETGQCLTASFMDYLVPTAMEIPKVDIGHVETPSPWTALGSRGVGEASCESVPAAIGNAVADALAPLGVTIDELPLTPNKIWGLMQQGRAKPEARVALRLEGDYRFAASQAEAWAAFMNARCLENAIPGCESLKEYAPGKFEARLKIGIPAVKGTYAGKFEIVDAFAPQQCRLVGEGSGTPGFVKTSTTIVMKSDGEGTLLSYRGDVQIGGLISGVGQRMIGGIAKMMLNRFFKRMSKELEGGRQ
jgi:2-furoyl-CoA dehydrogenase large subunit